MAEGLGLHRDTCETMQIFLRKGTFYDLGFYLYLKSRLREGETFRCQQLGTELFLHPGSVYQRINELRKQGSLEFEGHYRSLKDMRITKFYF